MKKKTVYLHIGSPKTGTSALQYFLLQNRLALSRRAFSYPEHPLDRNGISSGNAEQLVRFIKTGNPFADRLAEELLSCEHEKIILSSEYFFRMEPGHIEILRRLLAGADVRVIAYLRRQDSMMISAFHQRIKRHDGKEPISVYFEQYKDSKHFNNLLRLENWGNGFGKENLMVRPYEKRQYTGGDIFGDFLSLLGLDLTADYVRPERNINPSYRIDALEAKRLFNILPLGPYLVELDAILQHYSEDRGTTGDWPYSLLSPAQHRAICLAHEDQNSVIAREYMNRPDGRLFYENLPDISEPWQPYPGLSAEAVNEIADHIARRSPALAHRIAEAVTKAKSSKDRDAAAAQILAAGFSACAATALDPGLNPGFGRLAANAARKICYLLPLRCRKPLKKTLRTALMKLKVMPKG